MELIQKATAIVEDAQEEVLSLFANSELSHQQLEFKTLFGRILTRLQFMGGVLSHEKPAEDLYPPITHFMGEELKVNKGKSVSIFHDPAEEKQRFIEARDKLYDHILYMDNNTVLKSYTLHEHKIILRGVAKKAGVPEYETRQLDIQFIEDIKAAIREKNNIASQQGAIDDALINGLQEKVNTGEPGAEVDPNQTPAGNGEQTTTATPLAPETKDKPEEKTQPLKEEKIEPMILTAKDIAGDTELKKLKAKPGDELIIEADGKYNLKRANA